MAGGRPRTKSPPPEKVIELGKALVQWATEPTKGKELRCRFCQWYTANDMLHSEWNLLIDLAEFRPYYEQAQTALAQRFIDGSVNQSIAHRFLRIYCPEVKKEEDKVLDEAVARQVNGTAVDPNVLNAFVALMNQVSSMQSKTTDITPESKTSTA